MKGCEKVTHDLPALLWSLVSPRDRARSPYRSTHSHKVRGGHWGVGVESVPSATSFRKHSSAEQATGFPLDTCLDTSASGGLLDTTRGDMIVRELLSLLFAFRREDDGDAP